MKANYHTHTARCGHATGTDEDYVLAAIEQGFDELGFSDHVPWPYQDGYTHPSVRMRVDQMPGYLNSVRALALSLADRVLMLENAVYAILSPEGFASILWKDAQRSGEAAELMKLTAPELKKLGVIDGIVREPEGGAQTDPSRTLWNLDRALTACLEPLLKESAVSLTERRYQKFRALGRGKEDA